MSYAAPFPVDRLDPETFERFVAYPLTQLYPDADVRRAGSSGHSRIASISRSHGQAASATASNASASPNLARPMWQRRLQLIPLVPTRSVSYSAAWSVRKLLKRCVGIRIGGCGIRKTYPVSSLESGGGRTEPLSRHLLSWAAVSSSGRSEPGPWMTTEEFFTPFEQRSNIFSHGWSLVGRDAEMQGFLTALREPDSPVFRLRVLAASVSRAC